jgi:hypothetical protein
MDGDTKYLVAHPSAFDACTLDEKRLVGEYDLIRKVNVEAVAKITPARELRKASN